MLADIPDARRLNRVWESAIVSADLATTSLIARFCPEELPEYMKRAEDIRVYFNAVERIEVAAKNRDELHAHACGQAAASQGRNASPTAIAPSNWTTSGVTSRFSSPSRSWRSLDYRRSGSPYSGCSVVASEALKCSEDIETLSEESVKGIWKERIWEQPFVACYGEIFEGHRRTHRVLSRTPYHSEA